MARTPWRNSAVALAATLALALPAADAWALAVGRVSVQSSLGEPLRAEIDVPQITPDEVAGLRAGLGTADDFRAAGMTRNPALENLQITLQQRANGSYFLRLSGDRAVAEPFVDLILEATWPSGRLLRGYTLLFDPPATRPAAPIAAQVAPAASSTPAAATPPAPAGAAQAPSRAASAGTASAPAAPRPQPQAGPRTVTVESGQTAGRIAAAAKPATVSLDQMLVAMLRANPDAFIDGNVNRLKAGAVLELPTQEAALAVPAAEARETIVAQSRDFGEFRRRLAESVASTPQAGGAPARQAAGRIEAQVQEKKPAEATPDRLTLSKGTVAGAPPADKSSEERVARERAAQDLNTRLAELNRNLTDLSRLGAASGASTPASAASGGAKGLAVPAQRAQQQASAAPAPAAPASAPASRPATPAPAAAADNGGFLGSVLDNPLILAAAGGALALLAALAALRLRRGKRGQHVDSSFLESRLQPDSFFGASGGQRIDTAESQAGSSLVYSPSQIDAAGDVDPVAEADVYLAYGRDLQAEEILKEALRTNPDRVAIHAKLLEIYARRRDVEAFEKLATEAHGLTGGSGAVWAQIATLGLNLAPDNALYQGSLGWTPAEAPPEPSTPEPSTGEAFTGDEMNTVRGGLQERSTAAAPMYEPGPPTVPADTAEEAEEAQALAEAISAPLDLDLSNLDLDFTAEPAGELAAAPAAAADVKSSPVAGAPSPSEEAVALPRLPDLPTDLPGALPPAAPEVPPAPLPLPPALTDLGLDIPSLRPPSTPLPERTSAADDDAFEAGTPATGPARPLPAIGGMVEFDLSGISLDLPPLAPPPTDLPTAQPGDLPGASTDADPLSTKLALAEEFKAIGDIEGARSLAGEVRDEAQGELRQRAERLLGDLG